MKQPFSASDLFKSLIQQKVSPPRKEQTQTIWHWSLLILFSLLTYASLTQQLLLVVLLIGITALIKGPLMLLWGSIYSAVIAFFPPLAVILSLVFLLLNIEAVVKNWRITITGLFFYVYPLVGRLILSFTELEPRWLLLLWLTVGIISFHFLLKWLYRQNFGSRMLLWSIVSMPHSFFVLFLPKKLGRFRKNKLPNR